MKWLLLPALAIAATLGTSVGHADIDNKGTEFFVGFNPNYSTASIELHLTADVATNVTVQYPVNSPTVNTTVTVNPGAVTIVSLPSNAAVWTPNAIANNIVRAFATTEFVVYAINRIPFTSDAALALPTDALNTKHLVSAYNPGSLYGQFTVYAAFDGTQVTITPKVALSGGRPAGTPFTITLNRGQGYYGQTASTGLAGEIIGTSIEATRPVGVTSGNTCTNIPNGVSYCDHIFEISQPVQSWGLEVPVAGLPLRPNGAIYRILASENNTAVTRNGAALGTINAGQFIETASLPGNHLFGANKPIFVTQYMTGSQSPGAGNTGDPAMGNMIPSEQYLERYTFSTVGGSQFAQNFVTIVAQNADVGTLALDGVAVPAASFTPVPGTNLSASTRSLTQGTHTTSSARPHGITVEGYNTDDSYLYPGGARFQFINPQGDANPPQCTAQINPGPPPTATGTGTDNRPTEDINGNSVLDPGEDLNGNGVIDKDTGIFFVELLNAANTKLTTSAFTPGDPSVNYTLSLVNSGSGGSGTVRVTDGAGNTCEQALTLSINVPKVCDADTDGDIDRNDIGLITAARNAAASGPNDPRDADHNGTITVLDARQCTAQCTLANCAVPPAN